MKVMIVVWVGIFIAAMMQVWFGYSLNKDHLMLSAQQKLIGDLQLGAEAFDRKVPGDWKVENGNLYKGSTQINDNPEVLEIVDNLGKLMGSNTVTIFQGDTRVATNVLTAEGKRAIGTQISETVGKAVLQDKIRYVGRANVVGTWNQTAYDPIHDSQGNVIGIWYTGVPEDYYIQLAKDGIIPNVVVGYFSASIYATILFFILRWLIFIPIRRLQVNANQIANYNLHIEPLQVRNEDEIGDVTKAFNTMLANLKNIVGNVTDSANRVTHISENLSDGAKQTEQTSQEVAHNIGEIADGANSQAAHASNIMEMIEDTKEQVEIGYKEASKTAINTMESTKVAKEGQEAISKAIANLGSVTKTVQFATDAIQKLGRRSNEIGGIVTIISDIANQTNLLALNAAIEAARAGEQGRGFAVVSDEVRKLAEQSNQAAEKIGNLIQDIQAETSVTVRTMESNLETVQSQVNIIQEGGKALTEIVKNVEQTEVDANSIQKIFEQLTDNANQVLRAVEEISNIISRAASASQQVAAAAEEQSSTVEEIASNAEELSLMAKSLNEEVSKFTT